MIDLFYNSNGCSCALMEIITVFLNAIIVSNQYSILCVHDVYSSPGWKKRVT